MARNDRNWWNRSPGDIEAALTWVEDQMQGVGSSASMIHQANRILINDEIKAWPGNSPNSARTFE